MRIPKLCRHRASNRAYATNPTTGREIYFGDWSDPEAHRAYARWVAKFSEHLRAARPSVRVRTLADLCDQYATHAEQRYRRTRGEPGAQLKRVQAMARRIDELGMGWLRLVDLTRQHLMEYRGAHSRGTRHYQNEALGVFLKMMAFAEQRDWISTEQLGHLERIEPLGVRDGRGYEEVEPASVRLLWSYYRALGKYAPLLALHAFMGCRAENACAIRWQEIDTSREPWIYRPAQHKGAWRGSSLVIRLGPRARRIAETFRGVGGYWFATPSGHVSLHGYWKTLRRVQARTGMERLNPRQIRHTSASYLLRKGVPIHIISAILGHSPKSAGITGRYAVADERDVCAVVEKWG